MRYLCSLLLFFSLLSSGAAQKPEEMTEHTSTLGIKFLAVPGASVLFATTETKVSDWQAFLAASKHEWSYKPHFNQGAEHPVVGITLQDARLFCSWLTEKERESKTINSAQSYRLPTQDEWDAAVGLLRTRKPDLTVDEQVQDDRTFPWGTRWPPPLKAGNFADGEIPGYEDGFPFTAPVAQFMPNAEGLYDMAGNVWEWCWDPEIRAEQDGVLRGGSWAYFRSECLTSSYKYRVPGDLRMPTIGFRCVFEDQQRSAIMLATAEAKKEQIRAQRREEIMGGKVAKEDMEAMRKKLMGGDGGGGLPDLASLKPAVAGQIFKNSLGMDFVPVGDKLLVGKMEVRMQDFETWLKSADRTWENKPHFLLGGTHPAAGLTWTDARDFCEWLAKRDRANQLLPATATYRLPTDAEWSAMAGLKDEVGADPAAKNGVNQTHYPWSATGTFPPSGMSVNLDATKIVGFSDNYAYTAPVTAEYFNDFDIVGLGGNVAEWCSDAWPGADQERIIRGGSWLMSDKQQLLTSARRHVSLNAAAPDVGFRVVIDFTAP